MPIASPKRGTRPVFDEPVKNLQVWIPVALIRRVRLAAICREKGMSEFTAQLLAEGLDRLEATSPNP